MYKIWQRNFSDTPQKQTWKNLAILSLQLRSRPPCTGVLSGPGRKVPHRVLFEWFWAPASECPKESPKALFGALRRRCPKALKKHFVGHLPGPLSTPANGGRDRTATSIVRYEKCRCWASKPTNLCRCTPQEPYDKKRF